MTASQQLAQLKRLSRQEKLEIVTALWDDIAHEEGELSLPAEHARIIDERLERIKAGNAEQRPWSDIRKKYLP